MGNGLRSVIDSKFLTDRTTLPAALAVLLATLIVLTPLMLVQFPALIDYPVHLARQWILIQINESTALQVNYLIDWGFKPNLAMDLITPMLASLFPLLSAAKIFTALAMLSPVVGVGILSATLGGKPALSMLVAMCFVYNLALTGGFLNFLFGLGLALIAFARWLRHASDQLCTRILIGILSCIVLFFAHLFALLAFLVVVVAFELAESYSNPQRVKKSLALILSLSTVTIILWLLKPEGPANSNFFYGSLASRLRAMFSPINGLFPVTDIVLLLLSLSAVFLWFKLHQHPSLHPQVRWSLLALLLVSFIIPQAVGGGAVLAIRLPIALAFFLIASLSLSWLSPRSEKLFILILLLFLVMRSVDVTLHWRAQDTRYREFWGISSLIEPGAKVLALQSRELEKQAMLDMHVVTLSVVSRCTFVPHMAKLKDQHPIAPSKANAKIDGGSAVPVTMSQLLGGIRFESGTEDSTSHAGSASKPYYFDWPHHFDYLIHLNPENDPIPSKALAFIRPVHHGSFFVLYRVLTREPAAGLTCPKITP